MKFRNAIAGSLLIEMACVLGTGTLVLGLGLEMVRRAQYEAVLHHAAFLFTRTRVFGGDEARARKEMSHFVKRAFPDAMGTSFLRRLDMESLFSENAGESRGHLRYPAFFAFPYRGFRKHHFELTKYGVFP
jgi:hypothetical protein